MSEIVLKGFLYFLLLLVLFFVIAFALGLINVFIH